MVLTFEQLLAQRDQARRESEARAQQERQEQQEREAFTFEDLFNAQHDSDETETTTEPERAPETIASNFITYDEMMARTYGESKTIDTLKQEWLEGTGLGLDIYTTDKLTEEQLKLLNKVFIESFNKVADSYSPFVMNKVVLPQLDAYTEKIMVERKRKELGIFKEPELDLGDSVEVTKTITLNL